MAAFLLLLWAGLSGAAWVQVSLGLRPLRAAVELGGALLLVILGFGMFLAALG